MTEADRPAPVLEVDATSFQREVVDRSREVPVLIDFWATWCAPCGTLSPILEKLAREMDGAFVLAKVDVERSPELADVFRIQSVPAVILIRDGRPLDAFVGARSEEEVRDFLARHLGPAPGGDPVSAARELEAQGQRAEAIELLREVSRQGAPEPSVRIAMADMLIADDRAAEARKVFARLSEEKQASEEAAGVRAKLELAEEAGDVDELRAALEASPEDLAARIRLGRALMAAGRHEEGLEELWAAAKRDLRFDDGAPRKALEEAFQILGEEHTLTVEFRGLLSLLLCP